MKAIKIKQEKQLNGIWGTPLNCYYIENSPIFDDRKMLIFSAVIAALNEKFDRPFRITYSDNEGFKIRTGDTDNSFGDIYRILYHRYEVIDDTLFQFDNDQEHITFLRKHKLKKLHIKINEL